MREIFINELYGYASRPKLETAKYTLSGTFPS